MKTNTTYLMMYYGKSINKFAGEPRCELLKASNVEYIDERKSYQLICRLVVLRVSSLLNGYGSDSPNPAPGWQPPLSFLEEAARIPAEPGSPAPCAQRPSTPGARAPGTKTHQRCLSALGCRCLAARLVRSPRRTRAPAGNSQMLRTLPIRCH